MYWKRALKISPKKTKSNVDAQKPQPPPASPGINAGKFFQALIERRIADAEKELDATRTTVESTESAKGYLKALEGLVLTAKSNDDKYLYLSKVEKTQKNLKNMRREFSQQVKNNLHSDFDRGFFEALEAYAKILEHTNPASQAATAKKEA